MKRIIPLRSAGVIPQDRNLTLQVRKSTPAAAPAAECPPGATTVRNRLVLTGFGTLSGIPEGTVLTVTMIGAGCGGKSGTNSGVAGGGGGAGQYIRRKPYTYTEPIPYDVPQGPGPDSQTGSTIFGDWEALSATLEVDVSLGGFIGVGGGNTIGNGDDGFQMDEWTWAGANGGRQGGAPFGGGSQDDPHAGGNSPIADDDEASTPILGGAAGEWDGSPEAGSGPGGGGGASPFGSGGRGGNLLPVEAGQDAPGYPYGAGGGGASAYAETDGDDAAGGYAGGGVIIVEYEVTA